MTFALFFNLIKFDTGENEITARQSGNPRT